MDSRIKENPERTFDLVVQVACPASENEDPTVLWSFPQDHTDQEVLQTIPKFCFPFDVERVSQSQVGQNFTFVLTDIDGKQRFGFCRLTQGCRVCICLLSYLPWFEIYYKLLNTLADYLTKQQENDLNDMLNSLYDLPVPKPFTPVNLSVNEQLYIATGQVLRDRQSKEPHSYFIAPDINGLPTIPESRNLTEYFVAVDVNNMLQLYASMLHERRIIITSSKLSTLTACVHGAAALLFPMYWQHIFIPVLPPHLLDYCCAPMPYFVGVHLSLLERVRSRSLEDVVILNVDTNTMESPFDDLHNLPSDVVSSLKSKLKKQSTATGSGVARAFLRAQAALFGSYRDALRYKPGEPITFCEESFVNHRSSTMRSFLSMAVNLQLFKQFIDGRLAKLNAGRGFTDVFEEEITEGGFCGSNSRSYQQWMHTVKRGGALINTAVTKAKSHAKRGIRDIKGRLKAREEEEEGMTVCAGSPTSTKSLSPRRLQKMRRHNFSKSPMSMGPRDLGYGLDDDELDSASKISSEDSGDVPSYTEDSDDSYSLELDIDSSHSGQMNLLEEILDSLNTTTLEQGKLSAAKSLDFFRSMDDLDYKAPTKPTLSSESKPADESGGDGGGVGDQGGWNMGQDDSAVHGKHLPPSPRRQPNKSSMKVSKKPATAPPVPVTSAAPPDQAADFSKPLLFPPKPNSDPALHTLPSGRQPGHRFSYSPVLSHRPTPSPPTLSNTQSSPGSVSHPDCSPGPAGRSRTISDPQTSTEPPQTQNQNQTSSTNVLRRKVLSKETVRHYQEKALQRQGSKGHLEGEGNPSKHRQSAMPVPWEKEVSKEGLLGLGLCLGQGKGSGAAVVQDQGLLEEIESMCCLSSVLHTSLQLSQVHCNNSHHQVQGKATDES
ncbi:DENN domain-containing protein 1B-like [Seriola lalandi dorsalis]|uniref:DENN domain-containing protein 1B-like n=1 Tax=Seriola lalandi dorsalis TaxID=1841481 RepID=UPI000C6F81F8|nr:DENN domain-containing protein 1B-like [Seriola lalandi dorsalis]XP_056233696.1 DENN domain-containing protein 1B isoform X1 [Seriola aureovittata]